MADEEEPQRPPTYAELVEQNEALRAEVTVLRGAYEAVARKLGDERAKAAATGTTRRRPQRPLDPKAASPFDRPYDGR